MWTNAAGLNVKRRRGMTLPQRLTYRSLDDHEHRHNVKRSRSGLGSHIETRRRERQDARREQKKRIEAKRQRKLDALMMSTMRRVLAKWSALNTGLGFYIMPDAAFVDGAPSGSHAVLNEAVRLADEQIERVIAGACDRIANELRPKFAAPFAELKAALEQGRVHFPPAPPEFDPPVVKRTD